jgi:hypothetical protein
MKAIIINRPDDIDGVITLYPETVEDIASLETFMADGILISLKLCKHISANKRGIYFEVYYDRGAERKAK